MKLKIGAYEVDIKAKSEFNQRYNKDDTETLLLHLCVSLGKASDYDKMQGFPYSQKFNEEMWKDIHDFLDSQEGASDI